MKLKQLIIVAAAVALMGGAALAANPKREFRGAWMHTVYQGQYAQKGTNELQAYLIDQLDKLKAAGVNAVLFQVRPSADAFYPSKLEPWSRFLTKDGKAPSPYWDPLQFMIDETHKRGMELHAWLNPYRVTTSPTEKLAPGHIYHKEPQRFVKYEGDKKIYFDPGLPENRKFIEDVVMDIVNRYDVDGIHFDDYFYPYPAGGADFPDQKSFAKYGKGMKKADWRRHNVNLLIEEIHEKIASSKKPWVRFGVSPFGIWRNKKSDPRGSDTNGLQNYDDLYADVLLWAQKGWIDYQLPQLYWELEHKRASTLTLADWWNDNAAGRHMYFGQDVGNIMKHPDLAPSREKTQLRHKIELSRSLPNVQGNCWWPGYSVTANVGGVADSLANDFQSNIALVPEYPWISTKAPEAPKSVKATGKTISWKAKAPKGDTNDAVRFVVYRFSGTGLPDFDDASAIVTVTPGSSLTVSKPGIYYVTALNRVNVESDPSKPVTVK
ncbi:MAG: glycoside hydrolase family 10 protein [Muribaculaceae bacterium]